MNPRLKIGNAEVVFLKPHVKTLGIVVHLSKTLSPCEMKEESHNNARMITRYLIAEGFIEEEEKNDWKLELAGLPDL